MMGIVILLYYYTVFVYVTVLRIPVTFITSIVVVL